MPLLPGPDQLALAKGLEAAFSLQRLDEMLLYRLDRNRESIALGNDLRAILFRVVRTSSMEGWWPELVAAARAANPGSTELLSVAQKLELSVAEPPRATLEALVDASNRFLDVAKWRQALGELEPRVARVEIGGQGMGTAFLVGPSAALTNHHVVAKVLDGTSGYGPEDIKLRFDYRVAPGEVIADEGREVGLAGEDWLIDASPHDPVDLEAEKATLPSEEHLDHALLRLDGAPGEEPIGSAKTEGMYEMEAPPRGWVEMTAPQVELAPDDALFILQHPRGEPLKLALDTNAIVSVNDNATRVTYRTNTEPGSSGSPCFNQDWRLVALHHSGEPSFRPKWNEGIPIAKIRARLEGLDLLGHLSASGDC